MAVRFDAATDQIERNTAPAIGTSGWTLTAWIYLSVDRDDFSTFMRMNSAGSTRANAGTGSSGQGLAYFSIGGTITSGTTMTVGNWYRYAISIPGGGATATGTLYTATAAGAVDVATGTVSSQNDADGISFGGRGEGDTSEWFNGRVAYARMWTAALSQAEVEAEWAATSPARTSGLWADWPLTGSTDLADASGNSRNLTAGATAVTTEDGPPIGGSGATITPSTVTATTTIGTPTVAAGAGIAPASVTGSTTIGTPTVAAGAGITPASVTATTIIATPTVSDGSAAITPATVLCRTIIATPTVTTTSPGAVGSTGWYSLLAIVKEADQALAEAPQRESQACPNDGEPYRVGPHGELYCPFDGYVPSHF